MALTATNAYGNNTNTKSNYITVTGSLPTFVAARRGGLWHRRDTPALPSGLQTNDILLLFLETANQTISVSNQNGGTWTQVTNSPQGTGTAGALGWTALDGLLVPLQRDAGRADHQQFRQSPDRPHARGPRRDDLR